jgi:hypothetical protein
MADLRRSTDGPSPLSQEGYDESLLPDFTTEFLSDEDLQAFAQALSASEPSPSTDDLLENIGVSSPATPLTPSRTRRNSISKFKNNPASSSQQSLFITAQHDWAPVNTRVKSDRRKSEKRRRKSSRRSKDETREGYLYTVLKWPFLVIVIAWVAGLGISYLLTRLYIWLYEQFIAWRGKRERLRRKLHATTHYGDWVAAAKELDTFLGNDAWKAEDEYAYYDHNTVRRVLEQLRKQRRKVEADERNGTSGNGDKMTNGEMKTRPIDELKSLVEACVKNNFVGVENPRLYSQTYYGTKILVQEFIDESECPFMTSKILCSKLEKVVSRQSFEMRPAKLQAQYSLPSHLVIGRSFQAHVGVSQCFFKLFDLLQHLKSPMIKTK